MAIHIEKISLQILEGIGKLFSDVIRVLLNKSGYDPQEIEKYVGYIENPEGKGYMGMFEAVIESIIEGRNEARQEGIAIGQEQGIAIGQEQGIAIGQERLEAVARKAFAEGASFEFVSKITGFDMETVKALVPVQ